MRFPLFCKSLFLCIAVIGLLFKPALAKPRGVSPEEERSQPIRRELPLIRGEVIGISDGDTITVLKDRKPLKIRLFGVDSPEMGQPFGKAARQYTSSQLFGREVRIAPRDYDQYGRVIGIVTLHNGTNFNEMLIREGFAWWYSYYAPRMEAFQEAELTARRAKRGLWSDTTRPLAPWLWRRTNR
jgi:micrococcal nuclease